MKRQKAGGGRRRGRRMPGGVRRGRGSRTSTESCVVFWILAVSATFLSSSSSSASSLAPAEELPRITQHPRSAIIAHHLPVTLHCQAHPPTARVAWLFNGERLDPPSHPGLQVRGPELHFGHFRHGSDDSSHSNDGEYRCTASTSAGTVVSRPAVLSKPVLRPFPRRQDIVIEAHEGGFATLPCAAPYSHPPARVYLLNSRGQVLDESLGRRVRRLPSGSVVLASVKKEEDEDDYTCVAHNPVSGHNRSATHRVRLTVLPGVAQAQTQIVDRSTPTLQVREGEPVVLECPVTGVGTPSVSWTRGYGTLPHGHTLGPFGNLHIQAVKLRDVGTYICQTPGGQRRQVVLEVHMGPQVRRDPPDGLVRAREGDSVRLVCRGGALPPPSVRWFHDGGEVSAQASLHNVGEAHTLQLEEVRGEDAGLYVCELYNSVGQDSAVLQLVVTRPGGAADQHWHAQKDNPSDTSVEESAAGEVRPENSEEGVGHKRNFHLEVANNNQQRHSRTRKKNGRKKNKRRKNKKKGKAKVKLVPPSAPTVSRLSETSVLVHWTVPDNDGLLISLFRVQYREVRPNNGQWQTVDDDINAKARRYKVTRLKAGGTYKFRIAAVYSNNDNRNSPNSRRFHLAINPYGESRPPTLAPRVVEAKSFIYQNIYAIGIKWQYIPVDGSAITGFYIYHKPYGSQEDFKMETLVGAGIRNHLLTDLKADTEYSIKMQCFNTAGASDFSNMVVKRTLPLKGQAPAEPPTPALPPSESHETEAPPGSRRANEGLEQPVILGIVLGGLLLLLAIFLAMCWWKQRQQKRRNQSLDGHHHHVKYPGDPPHTRNTLYSDSLRAKPPNGGPYPLNGLNGVVALANGHGPNPLSDQPRMAYSGGGGGGSQGGLDERHHHHHQQQQQTLVASSQTEMYPGKPYYHGNGRVMNGTLPGYGHGGNSDNNFNKIRQTHSTDNMMMSSGHLPNGLHSTGSQPRHGGPPHHQTGGGGEGGYHPHLYPPPAGSSFSSSSSSQRRRRRASPAEEADSLEELEPLTPDGAHDPRAGEPPSYFCVSGRTSTPPGQDSYPQGCYGYGGSCPQGSRPTWHGEEAELLPPWSNPGSQGSGGHTGRHKRRRRRAQGEREHTVRDQATNTDLSSNGEEGTVEASTGGKSPAGSLSNGSDNSAHSDSAASADVPSVTVTGRTASDRLLAPVAVSPVGSV